MEIKSDNDYSSENKAKKWAKVHFNDFNVELQ